MGCSLTNLRKSPEPVKESGHQKSDQTSPGGNTTDKINGQVTQGIHDTEVKGQQLNTDGGVDPAAHGAQLEDRFHNNKSFQKPDIDTTNPEQQEAAVRIQTKYRQYHAKQVVQSKREEKAAIKIQAGYRGHLDREKVKAIKESSSQGSAEPAAEDGVDLNLSDPEAEAAATKIQAGYRGHKARKEVKELQFGDMECRE